MMDDETFTLAREAPFDVKVEVVTWERDKKKRKDVVASH